MTAATTTRDLRALSDAHSARNYHPLPVVISAAEGAWVTDVEGHRYLDMLAAYSAITSGTATRGWSPRPSASSTG